MSTAILRNADDLFTLADRLEREQEEAPHQPWLTSDAQKDAQRKRDAERLEPVALELARTAGSRGFTAEDLRASAIQAGIITGHESDQRALSWFGPFLVSLARRGLIAPLCYEDGTKKRRASARKESNGNLQIVYICAPRNQ